MEVRAKIKQYIEQRGIKQTFVAKKAGLDINILNNILNGYTKLSVERLQLISKALGVEPEFFLKEDS